MTAGKHVSAFALDALAIGALDRETAAAVPTHLASCERCRVEQIVAAELRAEFAERVLPRVPPARRSRHWLRIVVRVLAAAAVLFALWQRTVPPERPRPGRDDLAIKGDAAWEVFARRGADTFGVHDGTVLTAGDRIRFAVVPAGARYLIIGSVDGNGRATIYCPYGGRQSAPVDAPRIEPEGSIELDSAPGPERIFALLSDQPLDVANLLVQLRAVGEAGADATRRTRSLPIAARAQLSLVFEKVPPP